MASTSAAQDAFTTDQRQRLHHRARSATPRSHGISPYVEDATDGEDTTTSNEATPSSTPPSPNPYRPGLWDSGSDDNDNDDPPPSRAPPADISSSSANASTNTASSSSSSSSPPAPPTNVTWPTNEAIDFWTHWYRVLADNAERAGMSTQDYYDELVWNQELWLERDAMEEEVCLEAAAAAAAAKKGK
jgi:hypothetical protein